MSRITIYPLRTERRSWCFGLHALKLGAKQDKVPDSLRIARIVHMNRVILIFGFGSVSSHTLSSKSPSSSNAAAHIGTSHSLVIRSTFAFSFLSRRNSSISFIFVKMFLLSKLPLVVICSVLVNVVHSDLQYCSIMNNCIQPPPKFALPEYVL